jgi:phosphohistidine phosphatase
MFLYIIRHAWAGPRDDPAWPDDRRRPLTPEGRKRFGRLVEKLAGRGFAPAVIATSPLVRCRQTADLVAEHLPGKPKVVERPELAPDSDLTGILHWTAEQPGGEDLAWVGHAPDVGQMVAALIGQGDSLVDLAKGAVAGIEFDARPQRGQGQLRWLVTAKILGVEK